MESLSCTPEISQLNFSERKTSMCVSVYVMKAFKIYSLSDFQLYTIVLWTTVATLCTASPELIHFTAFDLIPRNPTPASGNLFFASMSSVTFDSTYKWNHPVFVCLCLTYFTYRNALKVHPFHRQRDFFLFYEWLIFLCVYVPLFLYLFIHLQTHIHVLTVVNNTSVNMG